MTISFVIRATSLERREGSPQLVSSCSHSSPARPRRNTASLLGSSDGFPTVLRRKLLSDFRQKSCQASPRCRQRLTPGDPDLPLAQAPRVTVESTPLTRRLPNKDATAASPTSCTTSVISWRLMCWCLGRGSDRVTWCCATPTRCSTSAIGGNKSDGRATHWRSLTLQPFCSVILYKDSPSNFFPQSAVAPPRTSVASVVLTREETGHRVSPSAKGRRSKA